MDQTVLRLSIPSNMYDSNKSLSYGFERERRMIHLLLKDFSIFYVDGGQDRGHRMENGNWTGLIQSLIQNESDVSAGLYEPLDVLFEQVGLTHGFHYLSYGTITAASLKAPPSHTSSIFYIEPIVVVISFLVILMSAAYLKDVASKNSAANRTSEANAYINILISLLGTILQKGFHPSPVTLRRRCLLALWLVMGLVVSTLVSSKWFAILTVKDTPKRVDSLEDILMFPNLKPATLKNYFLFDYLQNTRNEVHHQVYKRIMETNGAFGPLDFISPQNLDDFETGQAVYIADKVFTIPNFFKFYCQMTSKRYYFGKEDIKPTLLHIAYRRDLDKNVVEKINNWFLLQFETALLLQELMKIKPLPRHCVESGKSSNEVHSMDLLQMRLSFNILIYTQCFCILIFLLECVMYYCQRL